MFKRIRVIQKANNCASFELRKEPRMDRLQQLAYKTWQNP